MRSSPLPARPKRTGWSLCGCTTTARLGASVFVLGHRHPVLMAKMLTTIDTLSNGRLICGVGVGWWKQEIEILGAPFHARGRQADEMLRVFKELWTSDRPAFAGEFYRFSDIGFAPKPVQKPHPPIWVGGDSAGAFRRVEMHPRCRRRPKSADAASAPVSGRSRCH